MATIYQTLGDFGEDVVKRECVCFKCKRPATFKKLPKNFECSDVICNFCGFLAQVKTSRVKDILKIPSTVLGAAWEPQRVRMEAGIFTPLFLVLVNLTNEYAIYYLAPDFQNINMFVPRPALKPPAKRAGFRGFYYNFKEIPNNSFFRIK